MTAGKVVLVVGIVGYLRLVSADCSVRADATDSVC